MEQPLSGTRAGFTLVEVLVALVVLVVGLLALARGVVGLQHHARRAALHAAASAAVAGEVERLSVGGCGAASGTATAGPISTRWTRSGTAPAAVVAASALGSGIAPPVAESLLSARPCRPGS